MERVNDLLRVKEDPQSQNLPVKEDPETHSFYVDGIKKPVVSSPAEVHALLMEAEKRRHVAHTRYNEVSSRSHALLTVHVQEGGFKSGRLSWGPSLPPLSLHHMT